MSTDESSPLLPTSEAPVGAVREHPIFLRVTHSPWAFLGQRTLVFFRSLFMLYTTVAWVVTLHRDLVTDGENAGLFPFKIDNLSLTVQVVYYWITTVWAAQHLSSPRNRPGRESGNAFVRASGRVKSFISIPRTTGWTSAKEASFSAFYAMAVTYPIVVTFIHYFVFGMRYGDHLNGDFEHDAIDMSTHGVNAFIAVFEVLFLSSVVLMEPFAAHSIIFALTPVLYFLWAQLGAALTGAFPYEEVDPSKVDSMTFTLNILTSMAWSAASFLFVQGIHELRDMVAKSIECNRSA